ncbi:hypothetical protein NQ317_004563 [Molorchus minor]|uniref:RNA helicase aquarius N-terminal domain-containing protein n=1 Tax=Molorchus minor TaxID=1323400 RepID=A0ABQ9JXT7_9CUCU|nr:hypothetical protein NQ317_004563 [Molorchus minor]
MTGNAEQSAVIAPTVQQIISDRITQLAEKYWAPHTQDKHLDFDPDVIEDIYMQDIEEASNFSIRRIMVLEFSQYLENYLWPNYKLGASFAHMISIVIMVNEKFRERVQVWQAFRKLSDHFPDFFQQVLRACLEKDELLINLKEQTALLRPSQATSVLSMWISLQPSRREQEFKKYPKWKKYWRAIQRKDKPEQMEKLMWERTFLHRLMLRFMETLDTITEDGICPSDKVHYCERFLELVTDLEALLPTRRFLTPCWMIAI